jgi:hypothetical protein
VTFETQRTTQRADVHGGSSKAGTVLEAWYWNGGANQFFSATLA